MLPNFADHLRARRLSAQLSQEELAEAARISVSAVSAYERGMRKAPHRQTVGLLADALALNDGERVEFEAVARASRWSKRKGVEREENLNEIAPSQRALSMSVRAVLTWALGKGGSPLLAANVIRAYSREWLDRSEREQFINWLGTVLSAVDIDQISSDDLGTCWLLLAEGLDDVGEPLRASAARNCAKALGRDVELV